MKQIIYVKRSKKTNTKYYILANILENGYIGLHLNRVKKMLEKLLSKLKATKEFKLITDTFKDVHK